MEPKSRSRICRTLVLISLIWMVLICVLGVVVSPVARAQEAERSTESMPTPATVVAQGPLQQINKYFSTQTITYSDGTSLEQDYNQWPTGTPARL